MDDDLRRQLGSLRDHPALDDWVRVEADNRVVVRTGKAELGQGIHTALVLLAAEELHLDPAWIVLEGPCTDGTPDEGVTSGSRSIEDSGGAVRQACAHALAAMVARAADELGVPAFDLRAVDGHVVAPDGRARSYAELAAGRPFALLVRTPVPTVPPEERRWVGHGMPRVDLAERIRGEPVFAQDLQLPELRVARVVRPPRPGATLAGDVPLVAGEAEVVRRGHFVAVVADTEWAAEAAAELLASRLTWTGGAPPPPESTDPGYMEGHVVESMSIVDGAGVDGPPPPPLDLVGAATVVRATYRKPFLLHASIGPSAAAARCVDGHLTVWTHSQGVGPLRHAIAAVLGWDDAAVTVQHVAGPGCYGHNGADDVALDAALVATARPGPPVAVRWTRQDEHAWEPRGPAMAVHLAAGVDSSGAVTSWDQEILTYPHSTRPVTVSGGSRLLASWSLDPAVPRARATPRRSFEIGGHRNADPAYAVGARRVVKHDVDDGSALRTSALRSLGAFANVFAIESFLDELALASGQDPVELRLRHLADPRARAVVEAVVELSGGLAAPGGDDAPGRGLGFARYENSMTYAAVVAEVEVSARTGAVTLRRGWIAADAGEVVDPDGLVNQLEGGFVQAASWTLKEEADGVPTGWDDYPILRFSEVPPVETRLLDRPGHRPMGAGEATCGPTGGAIANAVAQATGVRVRDLPLRPARVLAALRDAL